VNAQNVIRNGEVILKSLSAAFLTFRFKPKRKRNFFIFEEESMGSNIFILKRQLIDCDWVETHEPPLRITRHSHNFADMKVIWRYGNPKYVI
jgi:hypothetical protein